MKPRRFFVGNISKEIQYRIRANLEQIWATNYNLTVGRYCLHQAEAVEYEKPKVLINRLLELEAEITMDLQDLLTLVTVPTTSQDLKGSIKFSMPFEE